MNTDIYQALQEEVNNHHTKFWLQEMRDREDSRRYERNTMAIVVASCLINVFIIAISLWCLW